MQFYLIPRFMIAVVGPFSLYSGALVAVEHTPSSTGATGRHENAILWP